MGMLINLSLVFLGTISLILGISYFIRERNNLVLCTLILLLGVFSSIWNFGYAFMGMTGNSDYALLGRQLGLFGILAFLITESAFLVIETEIPTIALYTLIPIDVLFGLIDFVLFGKADNIIFIRFQERTCFYAKNTYGRYFHDFFLVFLFISMFVLAIVWLKKSKLRREKNIVLYMIIANCFIVLFALPDTILPLLNQPSFPSSCYGGFLAYLTVWFVCNQMNAFSISVQNFSSYLYNNTDAIILVLDPFNRLIMANDSAKKFFSLDGNYPLNFSQIFEISDDDALELFSEIKINHSYTGRLVSKNDNTLCSITYNRIDDQYQDAYCTLCFVYDLSKESDILQELSDIRQQLQVELTDKNHQVEHLTLQAISTIANTIDAKDTYTKGHSIRVAEYSAQLAEALGYSPTEVQNIKYIALLHDIGKIGVPDNVLNKPGRLTDLEFELIKSHTTIGGDILDDISLIPDVAIGAKYHHERYDGRGYPNHLSGEAIPEIARIICIADSYDAMNSKRVYRNSLDKDTIRQELVNGRGTQFDPNFVDKFIELFDQGLLLDHPGKSDKPQTIGDESSKLLSHIMENIEEEKKKSSETDFLTGLLNRTGSESLIISSMERENGCLAFIDLDNLKPTNDQFGHLAGDHVLSIVADVLKKNSHNAIVSRIGGDEFLYYMRNVTEEEAQASIEGILHSFRSKKETDSLLAKTSLSIGLCLCTPMDTYADIYHKADKALYYVKQNGKDGYYFYHRSVETSHKMTATDLTKLVSSIAKQGSYTGSLGVEYRTFAKMYDFIHNLSDRYDHKLTLIMITVEPAADTGLSLERHEAAMTAMEQAIISSLRNVDVNTRFSSEQFLIILINAEDNSIQTIINRVFGQFYKNYTYSDVSAHYDVAELKGEQ